ncbi:helix-turn-helix transcriptional regulator [Natronosporangium hydrolyticum]|uniref:Helix-turn-helix transcriptional regulator n=1 Tax=Natronosporangium hydrolyticum TaxID=2811111 RepID=A0A895YIF2_9ACTN|nr:XRE family transcriptional regulator [Natronosporangium hydrolyticum]QSB13538.1 helix-turn-helix transcriptional regulator [Natronosporangium hydrolyticum]
MTSAPPHAVIAAAVRQERERAGLTLSELARRANVAKSTLSQLESGAGNPSVETLWALAVALDVPFSQLVSPPPPPRVQVVRAGAGAWHRSEQADFAGALLSAGSRSRRDLYIIELAEGNGRAADAHIPGSVEHLVVAAGKLRAGPVDAPVDLGPGDYATFPGDTPHHYQALAPGTWAVLMMEHPG